MRTLFSEGHKGLDAPRGSGETQGPTRHYQHFPQSIVLTMLMVENIMSMSLEETDVQREKRVCCELYVQETLVCLISEISF